MVDGRIVSDVVLRDAVMICEFLKTVDVFKSLTPTDLTQMAERMRKRHYGAGEIIIRQGDIGEEFFLIVAGRVSVTVHRPEAQEREIATLGLGDFFGEAALITGDPRNATVRATEPVETYVLGKDDFRAALDLSTSLRDQILRAYFQRQ